MENRFPSDLSQRLAALRRNCRPFGDVLRDLRERHDVTQKELARRAFTTDKTVSRIESGTQSLDAFADVVRYADALGCTADELAALIDAYMCSNVKKLFDGYEEGIAPWQSRRNRS